MDLKLIPFEDNPFNHGVLICRPCNRIVRIIPAVSPSLLLFPTYNLPALFESILRSNNYFICSLCCQTLCNKLLINQVFPTMYNCFLCKNRDSTPVSYLENVSKTLSGIFDILVYNTKYVCHDCIIVLADALCAYKMLSIDIHRCLKKIKECRYIASYICQPMILPSTVAKPFGKVTVFDIVRNIHLVDIEDLMRNTDIYIEGRGILFSRKDISHLIMELQTQREVFKCLAEVTQHLSLNSHSEDYAMLDSDSEYDYVTPVASITKSLKGIHFEDQEDSYITPNAEEMPVDWLLLDMTSEPDDFFKDEEFLEECEEEEIEEFYEGPSCSYKIPSKYKNEDNACITKSTTELQLPVMLATIFLSLFLMFVR